MVQTNATLEKKMAYATSRDFCRIFIEDMTGLYLLGLLLTGTPESAEQCFRASLDDAAGGGPVFTEWAQSWARRTVVRNAIRLLKPTPESAAQSMAPSSAGFGEQATAEVGIDPALKAVLELPPFDRFVFIITVLERMREHECSLLLGCSFRDVVFAKRRALRTVSETGGTGAQSGEYLQPAQVA
ncbi:MAG: hypothetical protein JO356_07545 [Acidobacteria bacterium]|nr:hypothetical protein [Acidobacteriota bacterium]